MEVSTPVTVNPVHRYPDSTWKGVVESSDFALKTGMVGMFKNMLTMLETTKPTFVFSQDTITTGYRSENNAFHKFTVFANRLDEYTFSSLDPIPVTFESSEMLRALKTPSNQICMYKLKCDDRVHLHTYKDMVRTGTLAMEINAEDTIEECENIENLTDKESQLSVNTKLFCAALKYVANYTTSELIGFPTSMHVEGFYATCPDTVSAIRMFGDTAEPLELDDTSVAHKVESIVSNHINKWTTRRGKPVKTVVVNKPLVQIKLSNTMKTTLQRMKGLSKSDTEMVELYFDEATGTMIVCLNINVDGIKVGQYTACIPSHASV
jgi:hypothetical protein